MSSYIQATPPIYGVMQKQKRLVHEVWAFRRLIMPTKRCGKLEMVVVGLIGQWHKLPMVKGGRVKCNRG